MTLLKKILERNYILFPRKEYDYLQLSFSQEGEDRILRRIFESKKDGFYAEIGAHHPQRFSNTYLFYLSGWRGINIDAMPGSMNAFKTLRPRDINIEMGIGESKASLEFFQFDEPALNTFDAALAAERAAQTSYKIINKTVVPVDTLENVFNDHLPQNTTIDFMSVDVEGFDLAVLQSNNWTRFRPTIVLVEDYQSGQQDTEIRKFMEKNNYSFIAGTYYTSFYKSK